MKFVDVFDSAEARLMFRSRTVGEIACMQRSCTGCAEKNIDRF